MYPSPLLNEQLKRFIPACSKSCDKRKLERALASPYLTYQAPENETGFSEEDSTAIGLMADDGLMRCPFPMFRFCTESFNGTQMLGFVERTEGSLALLAFFRSKENGIGETFYAATFTKANVFVGGVEYDGRIWDTKTLKDLTDEFNDNRSSENLEQSHSDLQKEIESFRSMSKQDQRRNLQEHETNLKSKIRTVSLLKGIVFECEKFVSPVLGNTKMLGAATDGRPADFFMAYYCAASIICYEYLAPQNFTAIVRPSTPGKSVEWLKAREHMTLIHRHHPANNAEIKTGSTIDNHTAMTRCAHSRRAHTRILRHSRYKYKLGQRISVRATWCGPKEWQDSAGQTYQILVPVV